MTSHIYETTENPIEPITPDPQPSASSPQPHVVIVGAGLAGLTCARHLHKQRVRVTLLEASDDVGGRVRSDKVDGYTLDRGFQVLFDQYPAVRRNLDLKALRLQPFDPGAIICRDGYRTVLTDPLRDRNWRDLREAFRTGTIPLDDKLRVLRLALQSRDTEHDQDAEPDDRSTIAFLREYGFSDDTIDSFFKPFYGGIFLERALTTTAAAFRFYFRMLATGQTTLPADGIGAITKQLAAPLQQAGVIWTNARVESLIKEGDRVVGVRLADGEELRSDAVVLATDAPTAAKLADLAVPDGVQQTTAIYFAGTQPLYKGRKIVLNANADAFVNNAQLLSNVAPSYAPPDRHLLSAAVLGDPQMDDDALADAVRNDLRRMFAGNARALAALETYDLLRVYRIRYAQFTQLPGIYSRLPGNTTHTPGLYVAAEWTEASSINGAMTSGERCAATVGPAVRQGF
jgi:phytoene dehydrogenase-like protein